MVSFLKSYEVEDKYVRLEGLYMFWTLLFTANVIVLSVDDTEGNSRDFNIFLSVLSTLFVSVSSCNLIYGNKLPSTMMMVAGPLYLYSFWLLMAYYQGDIFDGPQLGKLNTAHTVFAGFFTFDMVMKTWFLTCRSDQYLKYVKGEDSTEVIQQ